MEIPAEESVHPLAPDVQSDAVSGVNMAETESRIMNGQCLYRRMGRQRVIASEVAA